jgi:hypothetical protein
MEFETRYKIFNNVKYFNVNKWTIQCSLIGFASVLVLYFVPYLLYKIKIIAVRTFLYLIIVLVIYGVLGMILFCNYQNGMFLLNNKII